METLRGIVPSVPTETVEFSKVVPSKWKCDKCGVITLTLWRSSSALSPVHQNGTSRINGHSPHLTPFCAHRFCGQCLDTIFIGVQTVGKCPLDTISIQKKQVKSFLSLLFLFLCWLWSILLPSAFTPDYMMPTVNLERGFHWRPKCSLMITPNISLVVLR